MTAENAAPAEMPGVYRIADEFERELFAWRNLPSRDGAALRACAYALAQKAETLFAPILAEKQKPTVALNHWKARALAAEAALAEAEERCAKWADKVAAAIRAEGE